LGFGSASRLEATRLARFQVRECLRLFDYAVASALDARAAIPPASRGALQPRSEDWRRAKQVFLPGYRAAIGDCPSFPRNEALFKQLIEIFVLEKTLYEIVMGPPIARAIFHRPGS
jgi:predicted trehalose synthase